ncbi:MAG: dipeptide epimerase [Acidobacteria bacterium]|nr:MAG: dipeptide epimerase [Acidobacteriota bacterium]
MRIDDARAWHRAVPLTRPYEIAYATRSEVDLFFVELRAGDRVGLGSASPAPNVTGETVAACGAALAPQRLAWLVGEDPRHLGRLCRRLREAMAGDGEGPADDESRRETGAAGIATPAAQAAVDMALHDLFARILGVPLCDVLGRCHDELPTSITIGIKNLDETLAEAGEYLARGFRHLKVKIGHDLEEDAARLRALRRAAGDEVAIRVDANQGYDLDTARRLEPLLRELRLELIEQPLPAGAVAELRALPALLRRRVAADESLHHAADAVDLLAPPRACGIWNLKLMKCGGISGARALAAIAEAAGVELMWGCNDESAVSIAAALHAAYASPATRYLDLDGSFDLESDPATGGFVVEDGRLRLTTAPGLGVRWREG